MWPRVVNVIAGVWVMAAPAVLGYTGDVADAHRILGPVAASLAWVATSEIARALRWPNAVVGAAIAVIAWTGDLAVVDTLVMTITGVVMIGMAAVRGRIKHQHGGGWAALRDPL